MVLKQHIQKKNSRLDQTIQLQSIIFSNIQKMINKVILNKMVQVNIN